MKQINLATSVRNETISWGDKLSIPMVTQSFWNKERMTKLIESISHTNDPNSDGDLTNPNKVSILKLDANNAYKNTQINDEQEYFVTEFKPNN
jgi:hypothetical protein